jgi:hypothetical protein
MDRHEHTPEELAALELYHQLVNLSPDNGDRALMVTLRMPNGRYIGDVWLSTPDVQDLADASVGLAAVREHQQAADEGEPLLDVDASDVNDLIRETEAFLGNGGLD